MNVVKAVRWKGFNGVMVTCANSENQVPVYSRANCEERIIAELFSIIRGLLITRGKRGLEILGGECTVFVSLMTTAVDGSQVGSHKTDCAPWGEIGLL
jgi:hypothetical protein